MLWNCVMIYSDEQKYYIYICMYIHMYIYVYIYTCVDFFSLIIEAPFMKPKVLYIIFVYLFYILF